ncbi:MAG: hypothetical protein LQ342_001478 [Letrouitia transgressa]|nr:MAG: hypothetical protein LQ342_001478 [Letrouitia transgressa]
MPHSYGSSLLSAQSTFQNMQQKKKGTRAQQPLIHARADRANQAILDQLAALAKSINETRQSVNGRLDRMEQVLYMSLKSSPQKSFSGVADSQDSKSIARPQPKLESPPNKPSTEPAAVPLAKLPSSRVRELETAEASPSGSLVTIGPESVGGSHMSHEVSIQVEHATAAHRLLHWASIHPLVQQSARLKEVSFRPDYVMEKEEKKGVLRVYGRGQGRESTDASYGSPQTMSQQGPSSPSSSTSTRSDDLTSPASSPPEGLWGTGSIAATNSDPSGATSVGGSPSENRLDIHPRTLRRLFNSYLENLHILHPFLEQSRLTRMIERFSLRYNKSEQTLTRALFSGSVTNPPVDALRNGSAGIHKTAKRKHSSGHYIGSMDLASGAAQDGSELRLEHSISTAIVLLVMALGKICACKDRLPGPVQPQNEKQHDSPNALPQPNSPTAMQKGSQSPPAPLDQSPTSSNFAATNPSIPSLLSGPRAEIHSPRPADDTSNLRNVDVIPGLAYYAKATDILGNLHGLNDLDQVQSHLLAGLFAGQLARTFESWSWIHSACITCRFLVREANMRDIPDAKRDSIKFAFWTCSQLESDILAELDLPRSGIQDIPLGYPKGFMDDFEKVSMPNSAIPHQTIMLYYSGQIHIRNILNDIQHELYPPEDQERATRGTALRDHFNDRLEAWRRLLPPGLQWKDTDPPASNINDARLRAKFYGARYIVHRPFLRHALDNRLEFSESRSPRLANLTSLDNRSSSYSPQAGERRVARRESTSQTKQEKVEKAEILESAKICVAAAIQSTEAFDNIIKGQRLIVTNIFGTTHAQFGNMLVLAATYKSNLSFLIPRPKLEHLFHRTINLLRGLRPISDTLYEDAKILEILRRVVFEETNVSQSFSSDIS